MKLFKLTYNEILKEIKKKSFKVCTIILLLLALVVPFLFKWLVYDETSSLYFEDDISVYEESIVKKPKNDQEKLENELYKIKIDVVKEAFSNNEEYSSFNSILYEEYFKAKAMPTIIDSYKHYKNINYNDIYSEFNLVDIRDENTDNEKLNNLKELYKQQEESLKEVIKNNDYTWYLKNRIDVLDKSIDIDKYSYEVYSKLLELNVTDEKDFRVREGNNIIDYYSQKEKIQSEKEYNSVGSKLSYNDYVKAVETKNEELDKRIDKAWYSINHNIDYNSEITKSLNDDAMESNIMVLSVIVVIIAGGIVSNEFQKGTIRLLLVKPSKRWKILLSKFLAVIVLTICLALMTYIVSFIADGIVFGFKDYFIPVLKYHGNEIVEVNYILSSILDTFFALIPILFIALLAFSLSAITNNTALSVGISIFLLVGSSLIIMMMSLLNLPIINFTFLPYMDFYQFLNKLTLVDNFYMYNTYYSLKEGIIVLIVWSLLLYFIANFIFIKKDIKN